MAQGFTGANETSMITADSGSAVPSSGNLNIVGTGLIDTSATGSTLTINADSPVVVANGGTGLTSATAYAVLCGGTTSTGALQSIAGVGTAAQVLTSNGAGALPTFQDAAGGGIGGDTGATDNAVLRADGTGGATLQNSTMIISDAGEMTNASQPAFLGYVGTTISNCTGDGTTYILGDTDIGASLTEVYDQNSDFTAGSASGAIFTAPVTGKYYLNGAIRTDGYVAATLTYSTINTSNGIYQLFANGGNAVVGSGLQEFGGSVAADMDAADTATLQITVSGEASAIIDITANDRNTYFSGVLIC